MHQPIGDTADVLSARCGPWKRAIGVILTRDRDWSVAVASYCQIAPNVYMLDDDPGRVRFWHRDRGEAETHAWWLAGKREA